MAAHYLRDAGYTILVTNYRVHRVGEIDIIAYDKIQPHGRELVCVEVKSWNRDLLQDIMISLHTRKINRMRRVCADFLARRDDIRYDSIRFDVILIVEDSGSVTIEHVREAF